MAQNGPIQQSALDDILALARAYAYRRWGVSLRYLKFTLADGREQVEVVPAAPPPAHVIPIAQQPPPGLPTEELDRWATGPVPKHSPDFATVYWPGLGIFRFTPKQQRVLSLLWEARFELDDPEVEQSQLLGEAESYCTRLRDLFSRSSAWGALISQGRKSGTYRLPDPPPAAAEAG